MNQDEYEIWSRGVDTRIGTDAVIIAQWTLLNLLGQTRDGVYVDPPNQEIGMNTYEVAVFGSCPHLDCRGQCDIYDSRPSDCRALLRKSELCDGFKARGGKTVKISSMFT